MHGHSYLNDAIIVPDLSNKLATGCKQSCPPLPKPIQNTDILKLVALFASHTATPTKPQITPNNETRHTFLVPNLSRAKPNSNLPPCVDHAPIVYIKPSESSDRLVLYSSMRFRRRVGHPYMRPEERHTDIKLRMNSDHFLRLFLLVLISVVEGDILMPLMCLLQFHSMYYHHLHLNFFMILRYFGILFVSQAIKH